MPIPAIAPSPIARLLLELEARGATGGLDIGARRIVLTKGAIVEVRPSPDDSSLGDFLVAAGRLSEDDLALAKRYATEQRTALEVVLRARDMVPLDVLLDTRRALWLDRFVRGLAAEERVGKQPGLLTPEAHPSTGPAIQTLPFVLDGLARRAGFGDAEQVGREPGAWFDWLDTPQGERARHWADFGEVRESMQTSALFGRHPAAPSRIAALVRAGLGRLSEERSALPQPAPRIPVIAAPAPRIAPSLRPGSIAPPPLESMRVLSPGHATLERGPLGIEPVPSWFPEPNASLDDPLDALERRISSLEQSDASPAERARAWLDLARAFRTHHDSVDEAARASREAASADSRSPDALEAAAVMCSAVGRPDLAYAYAIAWADTLEEPVQRSRVLLRASEYATRSEKDASALRALRLASDAVSDDPVLGERLARALALRGDMPGAIRHARGAAERYRKLRPEAARAVLSWVTQLAPDDAEVASDYASALAADGYVEAAVAVIARAARRAADASARTKLWLHAAVRAELAARPDLASDLLLEALDRDLGDATQLHEPLANDLAAAGAAIELAWISSEIAERYKGPERSVWLLRAAEARLELPGDATQALELLTQALMADPGNLRAYELVVQLAESEHDPRIVSDAVERSLASDRLHRASALALLDNFLVRLETSQRAPLLERWAWAVSARIGGRGPSPAEQKSMEARLGLFEVEIRGLEQELRSVAAEGRAAAAVRLADRMRDDPARRHKARKLLEKVLEIDPGDSAARQLLAAIMRLLGDHRGLCALESQRVVQSASGFERVASELAWIHAELGAGSTRGAIEACLALLSHAPKNREALFLLWRLARKVKDEALVREALIRRVDASLDPRERARTLMAASRAFLLAGDPIEAVRRADAALVSDPRSAEAALSLVEFHGELEPAHRVAVLRAARAVLGDTPDLVAKLARACFGTRDPKGQLEALEAHARLSPFESFGALGLAALWATGSDAEAIAAAIRRVLAPERLHPGAIGSARQALERLWTLGHKTLALELVIEHANGCGEITDELITWALGYVQEIEEPRLVLAILERSVARASGNERRAEVLRRLAHFHRDHGVRHAEARAFLRLLAVEPSDPEALERLAYIYAETREVERLTAVLTLQLELSRSYDERCDRLLALALAALHLGRDAAAAQELVASALAPEGEQGAEEVPIDLVRRGVGILLASHVPQSAFDLLLELAESASRARRIQLLEEAVFIAERYLDNPDLALRAATVGLELDPHHTQFLLHFERLALDLNDVATGREVYRHLTDSAMGMHGQRAVLYRAARWLERAGSLNDALSVAEQAFALAPSQGAILQTLDRLARATGQYGAYVRALKLLGDECDRAPLKSSFYARAAAVAESELHDSERAFSLYETAFATAPDPDLEARALACVRRWAERDAEAALKAQIRWREMLEEMVKDTWSTGARVRVLISLGRLALEVFHQEADALRHVQEAEVNIEADEDLSHEERATLTAELNTLSSRLEGAGRPAPEAKPESEPVQAVPVSRTTAQFVMSAQAVAMASAPLPQVSVPLSVPQAPTTMPAQVAQAHGATAHAHAAAAVAAAMPQAAATAGSANGGSGSSQALATAAAYAAPEQAPAADSFPEHAFAEHALSEHAPAPLRAQAAPERAPANDSPDVGHAPPRAVSAVPYAAAVYTNEPFARSRITATMLNPLNSPRARMNTDPGLAPGLASAATADSGQSAQFRTTQKGMAAPRVPADLAQSAASISSEVLTAADELDRQLLALAAGQRAALAPLLASIHDEHEARTRCHLLLRATRHHGPNAPALEGLAQLAKLARRESLMQVCGEALSLFDPSLSHTRAPVHALADNPAVKTALLEARDDGELAPAFTMLAHVYQGAGPLFRRSLTSYGVSASDFLSSKEDAPYANALRAVAELFGVEHEAYLKHSGEDRIAIIPSQPPALLVGDKTHDEPLLLRYRMARAFERARPGSVLLSTLQLAPAEMLLAAVKAAFGPTDGKSPPVPREAAAMAAELWRTMPSSAQRQVGNLFRVLRDPPPLAALVRQLSIRTARVALIAGSGLDVAASALWTDPLATDLSAARSPQTLEAALVDDAVFRGLVAFGLSDAYLQLRDTLLESAPG